MIQIELVYLYEIAQGYVKFVLQLSVFFINTPVRKNRFNSVQTSNVVQSMLRAMNIFFTERISNTQKVELFYFDTLL